MVAAAGVAIWSRSAAACGTGAMGAAAFGAAFQALLVVFLLSVISLLSLRAASKAFGRMREQRPGAGFKFAHMASLVGYGISVVGTVFSGGLMLALFLM